MSEILQKLTILIVEDENEIRKLMEEVMKSVFFEVYSAKNGDEGIKKFKKFAPDLIVTVGFACVAFVVRETIFWGDCVVNSDRV